VLHVVAQNAGMTAEEIDEVDKQIQRLGITTESSRKSLTQFMQAKLDLKFAPALARAAQDLAVISGVNSSDTFARMIVNIQQLDTLGLRWMGIVIDRNLAEQKYKENHREITGALQKRHMQEALMLEVLEKAKQLEGTYSSAMGDVGKQLTSLTRYTDTYRQLLGDSLLPAYSAIVAEITAMFEKLIILSREFSANKERAQEWADTAQMVASAISTIVVTIVEHLGVIAELVEWYIKFKVVSYAISGSAAVWAWVTGVAATLSRLKLILDATRTAQVTMATAQKMLAAASNEEALALLKVAQANTAVAATSGPATAGIVATGTAATTTALAVELLAAAWRTLLITLAVPAIGYIIYKAIKFAENPPTPAEQASRLIKSDPMLSGGAGIGGKFTPDLYKAATGGNAMFTMIYEDWKMNNLKLVHDLQDDIKLFKEFQNQVEALNKQEVALPIVSEIAQARLEQQALRREFEALPKDKEHQAERLVIGQQMEDAGRKVTQLQQRLQQEMKQQAPLTATGINALVDKVKNLTTDVNRTRTDPKKSAEDLATAEATLAVERERLAVQIDLHEARLKTKAITDPTRKADEEALASMKRTYAEAAQSMEDFTNARKAVFGEDIFRQEGRVSAAFNKIYGGYMGLVKSAQDALEKGQIIPPETITALKEGMEKFGKAVNTPLDLTLLKESVAEVQTTLGGAIPGLGGLGNQALQFGQLGARQTRVAIRAPIVTESKERISARADEEIAAARRAQDEIRTQNALATTNLEQSLKEQIITLDDYYDQRIEIAEKGFAAEYALASEEILKRRALEAAEEDPKAKIAAAAATREAEQEAHRIEQRRTEELYKLDVAREDRRRVLGLEVRTAIAGQRAQYGGVSEALEQLNLQLEQELKKYNELGTADGERLVALKRITGEAEAYRKERERAYQAEVAIETAIQGQLDLHQQQRDIGAARDRAAAGRGDITEVELRRRNNARIEDAMAENRLRRESQVRTLEEQQAKAPRELNKRFEELSQTEMRQEDIVKTLAEEQRKLREEMLATEQAIASTDVAYEELAGSSELYSKEIKDTAVGALSDALTSMTTDFKNAGEVWKNMATSISDAIVSIFTKKLAQVIVARLFNNFSFLDKWLGVSGGGGGKSGGLGLPGVQPTPFLAEGGVVDGPGTGTSDSVPALLSTGEHVMPAAKAARWMPLLEGIRLGRLSPAFALGGVVSLQSIAAGSVIPRRYAAGGVVMTDGGASAVTTGGGGGNMVVSLHPDALNMTMRDWLEHEVVRQQGRR
jgi:hypothetical protein